MTAGRRRDDVPKFASHDPRIRHPSILGGGTTPASQVGDIWLHELIDPVLSEIEGCERLLNLGTVEDNTIHNLTSS